MPQSLSEVYVHLVFSTKERFPFFSNPGLRDELHAYLGGVSKQLGCPTLVVGGVADHVHLLARLGRDVRQSDWVKELKRVSNQWVKSRLGADSKFAWQAGYGAFSVSQSMIGETTEYIRKQEEHHRQTTFQDEYRALLRRYQIEWDERYVWD
ncbi:transposase [Haloferula helveola]|uniref:Transposase n=1 Tax=Haloferula helveola TaxID=490095 RepID=A0ABM7RND5_9BACT|nr:transposase [Haloferula helveola]